MYKNILLIVLVVAGSSVFSGSAIADCLDDGHEAFVALLDSIYEEMGSPDVTEAVAEAIDKEAWNLVANHEADLPKDVSISWVSLGNGINIAITCSIDEEIVSREERWEP